MMLFKVRPHKVLYPKTVPPLAAPPPTTLLVRNASQLLTLKGPVGRPRTGEEMNELGIIEDGAVFIRNGRIEGVGKTEEIVATFGQGSLSLDAKGKVVMPGFVDPHTHLVFSGSRERELSQKIQGASYLEIARSGGGILSTVRVTRNASLEDLVVSSRERLESMLRFGTTTAEVKSGYGLTVTDEIKILEAVKFLSDSQSIDLVPTFMGAHAIPPEFEGRKDAYVDLIIRDMIPRIAERGLAVYCDVFCEDGFFSVEDCRRILKEAGRYAMRAKVHADEFSQTGGAELAAEMNAISAEHLLHSSDSGLMGLAERKVVAVSLPGTSFSSGIEYAKARKMIDMGIPVALGTDLSPNCWCESMQFMVSLACYQMKMTPSEAICASTINAAYAIGVAGDVGSLEVGKKADLLILNVENNEQIPYRFGGNLIENVIKDGKVKV